MLNPQPLRGGEVAITCGGCRACCHQVVILDDAETGFDVETIASPLGPIRLLRRNADGACVYLVKDTCSIYASRPACCRVFDCGAWFRRISKPIVDAMIREGGQTKRMVKEGRRRARR